jgi:hypothetical protein
MAEVFPSSLKKTTVNQSRTTSPLTEMYRTKQQHDSWGSRGLSCPAFWHRAVLLVVVTEVSKGCIDSISYTEAFYPKDRDDIYLLPTYPNYFRTNKSKTRICVHGVAFVFAPWENFPPSAPNSSVARKRYHYLVNWAVTLYSHWILWQP